MIKSIFYSVYPTWLFIDNKRFIDNNNYYAKNSKVVQKLKYSCTDKET